ncbi:MAG: GIY-YIG nuclease family protein [Candidatus Brennerbacteria bacterium]|nr:GIY-YIG nuclease family protein [Candidatus Brennerbacteria bacterium]
MTWVVYILFCDQKTFYIGITSNLNKRLKEHKSGYSSYTKKFSEIKLVYQEKYPKKSIAEKRENQLKGWSIAKKKALIAGNKDLLIKLSKSFESGEDRR